jgi:hypothetical protein
MSTARTKKSVKKEEHILIPSLNTEPITFFPKHKTGDLVVNKIRYATNAEDHIGLIVDIKYSVVTNLIEYTVEFVNSTMVLLESQMLIALAQDTAPVGFNKKNNDKI